VCGAGLREGEAEVVAGVRGGGGVEAGEEGVVAAPIPRGRADNGFCGGADGGLAATAQRAREDDRWQNRGVCTPTIGSYRVVEIRALCDDVHLCNRCVHEF
jgi:hypothetical protein